MNIFGAIILVTLLARFLLDTYARLLNLRSLQPQVPGEVQDLYDPEAYARSQEYTRVNTGFRMGETIFNLSVFLIFWFSGGFNWVDQIVRSWGYGSIVTGILFIAILAFASFLLSLPFDIYSTFVIEKYFGFNRATINVFLLDRLKALLLVMVLGLPFLGIILWFFEAAGPVAWLYAWLFATAFTFFITFITPVWLMPLFNKFTPLPEGELRQAIADLAASVGFAFKDIFVVDASKRSNKVNALFTGFGRNKRIALFDTLVQQQTQPEIVAVLAHEIGHYKKKHVPVMLTVTILHSFVIFYLLSVFLESPKLYEAFYMDEPSTYAGLLFFGLLYEPISFLLSMVMNVLSRRHELQADEYAVQVLREPENLVSALKKLSLNNLANLTPHPLFVFLHYSHPPLLERVERLRAVPITEPQSAAAG